MKLNILAPCGPNMEFLYLYIRYRYRIYIYVYLNNQNNIYTGAYIDVSVNIHLVELLDLIEALITT